MYFNSGARRDVTNVRHLPSKLRSSRGGLFPQTLFLRPPVRSRLELKLVVVGIQLVYKSSLNTSSLAVDSFNFSLKYLLKDVFIIQLELGLFHFHFYYHENHHENQTQSLHALLMSDQRKKIQRHCLNKTSGV